MIFFRKQNLSAKHYIEFAKNFGKLAEGLSIPNLIEVQKNSYNEFLKSNSVEKQIGEYSKGIEKVFKT